MSQIFTTIKDLPKEVLNLNIDDPKFDFLKAKQIAKDKAFEKCDYPMILSWKNGKTGEAYPNYECGVTDRPFWIRYAEGRGANLTIDFNNGEYVFMVLKM
ncbi:MAG: AF1514 family protein [Proteobacteria bacterium]|nr:AF1514 family protein [Pseudomonadota bacterium]MBU1582343.1 AF1514 family protein [Pseudomonadota bacterium]MBU2453287.1 AF1514 family protein [Pseudomonadota bacterium]MBU2631198.1 AF1514 family protein [Pseudomonadota bacterium]